ncbi:MAG: hypothetical protein H0X62_17655, partial [Bacteroidetes bacterium]|nr:hypothetical protein [Bacteroidota bacterium]
MKKKYLLRLLQTFLFIAFSSASYAQLSGVKTIPGDYVTIAAAITDLNASGVATGGVTFNVAANYTETGMMPVITATGTVGNPIVFQKSGTGTNPTITAGTGIGTRDGVIVLQGTDYITFDGINVEENAANTTATTQMEWGYALLKASGTDGSQNVIIKNSRIILSSSNISSVGIYSANQTPATTTSLLISNIDGTNSYNHFYSNIIVGAYNGIVISSSPSFYDIFNEVGVLGANIIANFGGGASTAKGIYTLFQNDLKIVNNNITSRTGTNGIVYGIHNDVATSSNVEISNNTITVHGGGTTQLIMAIYNQAGSTPSGNNVIINDNIIQDCTYPTATSGGFQAIQNIGTAANVKINGNTISDFNYGGTATLFMINSNTSNSDMLLEINNNTINNITRTGTGTGATYIISAATAAFVNLDNNNIYNISKAGSGVFRMYSNIAAPLQESYSANNIYNITNTGSGITAGIYSTTTAACISTINSNQIYNFTTNATITYGIYKTTGTYSLERNKINDINANLGEVVGIYTGAGTATLVNNLIANLDVTGATGATMVSGIRGAAGSALYLFYNTIYLNATSNTT